MTSRVALRKGLVINCVDNYRGSLVQKRSGPFTFFTIAFNYPLVYQLVSIVLWSLEIDICLGE